MAYFMEESFIISRTLDQIGYSKYIRTVRQNAYKCIESSMNRKLPNGETIISGSKGEGLSAVFESDFDQMLVISKTVCSEFPVHYCSGEQRNIFQLLKRCTAPGYAILQLSDIYESHPFTILIKDCLVELLPGHFYISSDIWKHTFKQIGMELRLGSGNLGFRNTSDENHGPSTFLSTIKGDVDNVMSMTCNCPSYLYSWKTRERQHEWPTTDVIDDVSKLESHVVPVGYINSPLHFLEWRICYTKGEIRLIRSLPDCLIKVYILMKAIVKVTLKPICKEISSYIIKNIVLWIAELCPMVCFSESNMVIVLQHGFKFLKHCLGQNNLPSYMIPERNLFADRLTLQQRSRLCMRIDFLLREGHKVVFRIKKVRDALNMLYRTPEEFRLFSERRQITETLMLMLDVYTNDKFCNEAVDINTVIRNCITDDVVISIVCFMFRLIPELDAEFGEVMEVAIAIMRTYPEYVFRILRKNHARSIPLLKYLS